MPSSSPGTILQDRQRWQEVSAFLARQFSQARDALQRIQAETVESSHITHEAFAVRNLQVVAIETLDFLREHWEVSQAAERGQTAPNPVYRVGRWREVLDVTHPARPYNPFLGTRPYLRNQIEVTREQLKKRGIPVGAVDPNSADPLVQHFAKVTRAADSEAADRVTSHETLGILRAFTDLANVAAGSPTSTPTLRHLSNELTAHVRKVERAFLESLKPHLQIPAGSDPLQFAKATARNFQNIGLLRAEMRKAIAPPPKTADDETKFLKSVTDEWVSFHLGVKPVAWFETLLRLSKEDIASLNTTIGETKAALLQSVPLYAELPSRIAIETAVEPLVRNLTTAQQNAPFLDRHRETFIKAGRATTEAALAYAFALAPLGILALGETGIYTRHVAPALVQLRKVAATLGSHVLAKDTLKDQAGHGLTKVRKALLAGKLDQLTELWRSLYFTHFRKTNAGNPARRMIADQHRSLRQVFGDAAENLAAASWRNLQTAHASFLREKGPALTELIAFDRAAAATLSQMRRANRAYQEFDEAHQTPAGVKAPAAYLASHQWQIDSAQATLRQLSELAAHEGALRKLAGIATGSVPRAQQYWTGRHSWLHAAAEQSFRDAVSRESSTTGDRPLALMQVRYDPSPLDPHLWALVEKEDRAAANAKVGDIDMATGPHFGVRFHNGLPPTYHMSWSLVRAFFPAIGDRAVALQVLNCAREPGAARLIQEDLKNNARVSTGPTPIPISHQPSPIRTPAL